MTDEELRQLIESNARAVQANSESIRQLSEQSRRTDARLEALVEQSQRTDARLEALAEQSQRTDIKLDRLSDIVMGNRQDIDAAEQQLRTSIDDTVAMIADLAQQQQATDQRFTIFLEESRADRQRSEEQAAANATEHRAFQQITQTLLAEIARLWQRLAG
jgi:chromosome segregation ATPase